MEVIRNEFTKPCEICQQSVDAGNGYSIYKPEFFNPGYNSGWKTYCDFCASKLGYTDIFETQGIHKSVVARIVLAATEELKTKLSEKIHDDDLKGVKDIIDADPTIVNEKEASSNYFPVHVAYLYRNLRIMDYLLSRGADPTKRNNEFESAFEFAIKNNNKEALRIFQQYGYKTEQEEETGSTIQEKFNFEGFAVVNAGIMTKQMEKVLDAIRNICKRMKKFGFGHLFYGPLIITSNPLHGETWNEVSKEWKDMKWGAYYSPSRDLMVVNADSFISSIATNMQLFAHELGHREWYKFLSPSQRQLWNGKYQERGHAIRREHIDYLIEVLKKCTPDAIDNLGFHYKKWNDFNYACFLQKISSKQDKYYLKDIFDTVVLEYHKGANIKAQRRKFMDLIVERDAYGGSSWCSEKMDIASAYVKGDIDKEKLDGGLKRDLLNSESVHGERGKEFYEWMKERMKDPIERMELYYKLVGKLIISPESSTEYGKMNDKEDYAEAFGNFMANHGMPKELLYQFIRLHSLKMAKLKHPK